MKIIITALLTLCMATAQADISIIVEPITSVERAEQVSQECKTLQRAIELRKCADIAVIVSLIGFEPSAKASIDRMVERCKALMTEEALEQDAQVILTEQVVVVDEQVVSEQLLEEQEAVQHSDLAQSTE